MDPHTSPARPQFTLNRLSAYHDSALLALRVLTGAFLVHGVWDNVTDAARMHDFVAFVRHHGFAPAAFWAHVSVYAQLKIGLALVLGLATRWAALICAGHFVVAWTMVHMHDDFRVAWPALALIAIGCVLATGGPGRAALDSMLSRRPPSPEPTAR